jgi:D-sedoheptulose 7-phosphate isomerase
LSASGGWSSNWNRPPNPITQDPFIHQELIEILYHTLWETVHIFFEHRELGHDVGEAGFLYPFLGKKKQETVDVVEEVARSIQMKAQDDALLRAQVAKVEAEKVGAAAVAIRERIDRGGKLIIFGNGGSATDANDWAIDCVMPPEGYEAIPAISLSMEPANLLAIANDVGTELIFSGNSLRRRDLATSLLRFPPEAARKTSWWRWKRRVRGIC